MNYGRDPAKANLSFAKHGVRFADAVFALEDALALTMRDPFSENEERWITLGIDALGGSWSSFTPGGIRTFGLSRRAQRAAARRGSTRSDDEA